MYGWNCGCDVYLCKMALIFLFSKISINNRIVHILPAVTTTHRLPLPLSPEKGQKFTFRVWSSMILYQGPNCRTNHTKMIRQNQLLLSDFALHCASELLLQGSRDLVSLLTRSR